MSMSSDTLFIFLKGITKWNQSAGTGRKVSVLTPRTHACRYLDGKITKPCVFIHTWAGPHHAGVRPLSWFWWHHNERVKQTPQGADRFQWPETRPVTPVKSHCRNPMYKICWAVNIASVVCSVQTQFTVKSLINTLLNYALQTPYQIQVGQVSLCF